MYIDCFCMTIVSILLYGNLLSNRFQESVVKQETITAYTTSAKTVELVKATRLGILVRARQAIQGHSAKRISTNARQIPVCMVTALTWPMIIIVFVKMAIPARIAPRMSTIAI